eukprot:4565582-Prymnesium_polylepis.1
MPGGAGRQGQAARCARRPCARWPRLSRSRPSSLFGKEACTESTGLGDRLRRSSHEFSQTGWSHVEDAACRLYELVRMHMCVSPQGNIRSFGGPVLAQTYSERDLDSIRWQSVAQACLSRSGRPRPFTPSIRANQDQAR